MMSEKLTQKDRLILLLKERTLARANELQAAGIAATTISRAVTDGDVSRIGRGLYQLPDNEANADLTLAEASKRVPKGIICMISALAYHGLTDQMPRKIWMAIGAKDWEPKISYPPLRIVRFRPPNLNNGVEYHLIAGTDVPIYSVTKALADAFRNPKLLDRSVAIECLRNAITSRKVSPGEIADMAKHCGAWKRMQPYMEAITHDG